MNPLMQCADRNALEAEARHLYQTAPLGNGVVLCRVLGKYVFYADVEDIGITPHLCLDGFWESWITLVIMRVVQPGWRCIDIGANFGYYTLLLADLAGPAGCVLAIEPNPQAVRLLERSVEVNGFQNFTQIVQCAASDRDGKRVSLAVPRARSMDASLFRKPSSSDNLVSVQTVTVDEAAAGWPQVDFIKIDTEGSEESIWRGMRRTLQRNPQISIIMEWRYARYRDPHGFLSSIRQAGFTLRYIDYDGSIRDTEEEKILDEKRNEDWMLFLQR